MIRLVGGAYSGYGSVPAGYLAVRRWPSEITIGTLRRSSPVRQGHSPRPKIEAVHCGRRRRGRSYTAGRRWSGGSSRRGAGGSCRHGSGGSRRRCSGPTAARCDQDRREPAAATARCTRTALTSRCLRRLGRPMTSASGGSCTAGLQFSSRGSPDCGSRPRLRALAAPQVESKTIAMSVVATVRTLVRLVVCRASWLQRRPVTSRPRSDIHTPATLGILGSERQ